MSWEHKVPKELAEKIVEILHEVTGNNVQFMGNNGEIIATTQPERLGDIHEGAQNVMAGREDYAAIDREEAEEMEGCLPGYTGPIEYEGERIACIGITGPPEEVKPLQKMGAMVVSREISQEKARKERTETINEVFAKIEEASATAQELTASAQEISSQAKNTEELLENVNESLDQTEKIYSAIRKIAEKTTILGLNASIEAARLGDEGAGFNVVAEEIRELSENSKQSIEEIDEILDEIRSKMADINETASDTSSITSEQAQSVESLTENIMEIQEIMETIIEN